MKSAISLVLVAVVSVLLPCIALAQEPAEKPPARTVTALMVEITVNRYLGQKRLSSVPYTLAVTPDGRNATLRVGGEIAVPTVMPTPAPAKSGDAQAPPMRSFGYRAIGTNIDVSAVPTDESRYRISVTLEESSVYPPREEKGATADALASGVPGAPAFRSLRTSNTVSLKDGQTVEFTAATDRISGEVARISVKLTVVE